MKRGEVWWVEMPPPAGRRPAVLLSRDSAYRVRAAVTVAPITRTIRHLPVEVFLDQSDGMPARCVVNLDDITTLPKILIRQQITALSPGKIQKMENDLCTLVDSNGEKATIHKDGIYKIVEHDKKKQRAMTKDEEKYYKQVWGPKYAKDLTKKS